MVRCVHFYISSCVYLTWPSTHKAHLKPWIMAIGLGTGRVFGTKTHGYQPNGTDRMNTVMKETHQSAAVME